MSDPPANQNDGLALLAAATEIVSGHSAAPDVPAVQLQSGTKKRNRNVTGGPPKKRQKTTGQLASLLLIMPTELFYKIFGDLGPEDLLQLARTAKIFATFLLGTSTYASSIWRTARLQSDPDIPDTPFDLTEQKYAVLLFGSFCQRCGRGNVQYVSWNLRRRLCLACRTAIVAEEDPNYRVARHIDHLRLLLLGTNVLYYDNITSSSGRTRTVYLVDHWLDLKKSRDEVKANSAALEEFDQRHEANEEAVLDHASECGAWQHLRKMERSKELANVRKERETTIKEKLIKSGCEPLLVLAYPWGEFKKRDQSKPLTDRAWNKLKPEAVKALEEFRIQQRSRLYDMFRAALRDAYEKWSKKAVAATGCIYPPDDWMASLPLIKQSLNYLVDMDPLLHLRGGSDVKLELSRPEMTDKLNDAIIAWRNDIEQYFLNLLPPLNGSVATRSAFSLSISIFRCAKDGTCAYFPDLWYHVPGNPTYGNFGCSEPRPWPTPDYWTFDKDSSAVIRNIILACDANPDCTTRNTMDSECVLFVCLECSAEKCDSKYGPVMKWRRAVDHWRTEHKDTPGRESRWRPLSPEEQTAFRRTKEAPYLEMAKEGTGCYTKTGRWLCKACFRYGWVGQLYSLETLKQHFVKGHNEGKDVDIQRIIQCFILDPAAPLLDPPSIFWNPKRRNY